MIKKFIIIALVLFSTLEAHTAFAADISIVPDKTQVSENETFGATVYVSSPGMSINNAEGIVSFPTSALNVVSISTSNSIFNIWVDQPTFSNSDGTVSFNGGIPNPGFNGKSGAVIRIIFRAKNSGSAQLSFDSASVRANDGLGTDVTNIKTGSTISIIKFNPIVAEVKKTVTADTAVPEQFEASSTLTTDNLVKVFMLGHDRTSGISAYLVFLDGIQITSVNGQNDIPSTYTFAPMSVGNHFVFISAVDKAGNLVEKKLTVTVPDHDTPKITIFPQYVTTAGTIAISGETTYPNETIAVWVAEDDDKPVSHQIRSQADRTFTFETDTTSAERAVSVWVEAMQNNTSTNIAPVKIFVQVRKPHYIAVTQQFLDILYVMVPLAALIILVYVGIYIGGMKFKKTRVRLKKDLQEVTSELHSEFASVRTEIAKDLKVLKKAGSTRSLSREEERILSHLSETIDGMEKTLARRLKNIKDDDV